MKRVRSTYHAVIRTSKCDFKLWLGVDSTYIIFPFLPSPVITEQLAMSDGRTQEDKDRIILSGSAGPLSEIHINILLELSGLFPNNRGTSAWKRQWQKN